MQHPGLSLNDVHVMVELDKTLDRLELVRLALERLRTGRWPPGLIPAQHRLWDALRTGEGVAEARAAFERLAGRNRRVMGRLEDRKAELEARVGELRASLSSEQVWRLYLGLRRRRGRAVVGLVGEACGACRVLLAAGQLRLVRRGRPLICPNCGVVIRGPGGQGPDPAATDPAAADS